MDQTNNQPENNLTTNHEAVSSGNTNDTQIPEDAPVAETNPEAATADSSKTNEKKPEHKPEYLENSLELHSMSRKERRKARRAVYNEYVQDMTATQKFTYFISYYKWYILLPVIAVILLANLAVTIYRNKLPMALSYVILNVEDTDSLNTDFQDDYVSYNNITGKYQFYSSTGLDIDYDYFKEHEEYITTSTSTDYNVLSTQCELGDFDVIITNATGLKYCSTAGIANPLKGYLDSYCYNTLQPYMQDSENANGNNVPYALDISDTDFAKNLNLGYSDVYLALPGTSDRNKKNALQLIEYIYGIDLTEEE